MGKRKKNRGRNGHAGQGQRRVQKPADGGINREAESGAGASEPESGSIHQGQRRGYLADILLAVCLLGLMIGGLVLNVTTGDRVFSTEENRTLQQVPELTAESIRSGRYADTLEKWLADQFVGRSFLRRLWVMAGLAGGGIEEQNVLVGEENQLAERIALPDAESLALNLEQIGSFAEAHPETGVVMMLVPDAGEIWRDKFPAYAELADQRQQLAEIREELGDRVQWVDAADVLEAHRQERIYYKTDHHWTTLGAYYGYLAYSETVKGAGRQEPEEAAGSGSGAEAEPPLRDYQIYTVTDSFRGVLARNSGFDWNTRESIEIYVPEDAPAVAVTYPEEQKRTTSLYQREKLEGEDPYAVFLGGNCSLADIRTASRSGRKIMVVKDSFANCFVPFLTPDYSEILVVDPRYYAGSMEELLADHPVDEILFLYRMNTFVRDNHLYGFLE